MKLILKNIGLLRDAAVKLDGLTVIAGENDNGKSTVGKVVFCLVKAINRYKEDLEESKDFKIEERLKNAFFIARRTTQFENEDDFALLDALRSVSSPNYSLSERINRLNLLVDSAKNSSSFPPKVLEVFEKLLEDVLAIVNEPEDVKKSIENALNKVFVSEFDSSILHDGEEEGFINLYEGDIKLIEIRVGKDKKIHLLSKVEPIEQDDATFIESSLILNNHDLLIRSKSGFDLSKRRGSLLGIPFTTLHTKDLFDKLREPPFGSLFNDEVFEGFNELVRSIISGEIVYDDQEKDFVFKKNNKSVSIKNTASGIKVFGILQLLSSNGFLKKHSFLVFDEPETHLHPNWQLKLAHILVKLAKNQINIIVSSHSPYMIEALKRFSDAEDLTALSGFFLAEKNTIENRNRLDEIFSVLSEPFETFRKMDLGLIKDE